ncbi:MAG: hypothetical protein RL490_1588, partial [Pseudomonadota bacterium]
LDLVADDVAADTQNRQRPTREGDLKVADVLVPALSVVPPQRPPVVPDSTAIVIPGPYFLFFNWDATTLTPEAASTLDLIIARYRDFRRKIVPGATVDFQLAGHTDKVGTRAYTMEVAARRAAAVRDYMLDHGISAKEINILSFGDQRPLVETPPGVREPQNRRVEITIGVDRLR